MDTRTIVTALVGLAVGVAGTFALGSAPSSNNQEHVMPDGSMMHGQMNTMTASLEGKTGDEFDKAFLAEMIVHHEGAVQMAEMALQSAGHIELKEMAEAIISAQNTEIFQMKEWQKTWYGN